MPNKRAASSTKVANNHWMHNMLRHVLTAGRPSQVT